MKFNPLDILLPRETKFYAYISEQVEVLISGCRCFKEFVDNITDLSDAQFKEKIAAIKEYERRGDQVERHIIDELHKTFITPFDREDIHTIAINIERALDILNSITQKFEAYHIRSVPVNVCRFADLLIEVSTELRLMMEALRKKGNVMKHVEQVHVLENTGDDLFHSSMAELFDGQHDPIDVLKFKEVYEHLESCVDAVDFIGRLVRGVKVKLG